MHLSSAQFVEPMTIESVWEKIFTLRATLHTCLSYILVFDYGLKPRDSFV